MDPSNPLDGLLVFPPAISNRYDVHDGHGGRGRGESQALVYHIQLCIYCIQALVVPV